MDRVIVAFASDASRSLVRDMLEREGIVPAAVLPSGAGALRAAARMGGGVIVSGFRLSDMSVVELAASLPETCILLVIAPPAQLDLFYGESAYKMASPASRSDLASCMRALLREEHQRTKQSRPARSDEDNAAIENAKTLLMERDSIPEQQAHRFLQKKSMDSGTTLADTAKRILSGG